MAEFWRTKSFKVLSKTWNQKLEESGFLDAEIELKGDRALRQKATNCYRNASELERETRLRYYALLGYLAHNTSFPNDLERIVMLRHSEGVTIKEILEELMLYGIIRDRKTIRYIIRRWQAKWGIRAWSPRQMNLKSPVIES